MTTSRPHGLAAAANLHGGEAVGQRVWLGNFGEAGFEGIHHVVRKY